jgi:hypothetical protein
MKDQFQFFFYICGKHLYLIITLYQSKTTYRYYLKLELENLEEKKPLI